MPALSLNTIGAKPTTKPLTKPLAQTIKPAQNPTAQPMGGGNGNRPQTTYPPQPATDYSGLSKALTTAQSPLQTMTPQPLGGLTAQSPMAKSSTSAQTMSPTMSGGTTMQSPIAKTGAIGQSMTPPTPIGTSMTTPQQTVIGGFNKPTLPGLTMDGSMSSGTTMSLPPANSGMTPGGLGGYINNERYTNQYGADGSGGRETGGGRVGYNTVGGGGLGGTSGGANTQGFGNFDQFRDSALEQAMRSLNPRIDSQNAAFEQMMVSRGIQPGTAQYDAQRRNLDMRNSDLLSQAEYGAQQQGLAAQNQAWNQDYQYDALANALQQTQIGANASMYGSNASANASMYNSDNNLTQAQMANALGYDQLNQRGREFDINDIYRTNQQDINAGLGWAGVDIAQQGQDRADWQANQGADANWWNQITGMMNNAPGVNFTGAGDLVGNTIQAGQNAQNNTNAQNAAIASLLGSGMSMFSDKRLKENIEFVDNVDGVNVYDFDYIDKSIGADRYRGVMAQEIKDSHPDAISEISGFMMVDYSKLPVNMEVVK